MHPLDQAFETIRREFEASGAQMARAARYQLTNELNQLLRRFRHYQKESEWISALLDGATRLAQHVAIFSLQNETLRLRAQSNLELPDELTLPLASAPAFLSAVETHDPVIALRAASEVGEALAASEPGERCHLIPIMNGPRTVAVLFAADREYMDVNALELIAGVASAVLERHSNVALHSQITEVPKPEAPPPSSPGLPTWADLSEEQRTLHIRAQRFARVTVAELQLAKPQGCRIGREQNNLYLFLKPEIDKARESYRKQFMTIPSMVDYLHLELVKTAAEGDEVKLGAEYPGQLV